MENKFKVLFIYPNAMMVTLVPIHFSLLSACLKAKGFEVDLFDTTYYKTEEKSFDEKKVEFLQLKPFNYAEKGIFFKETDIYEDLAKKVADFKPDLIGLNVVEDTWGLGQALLGRVKKDFNIPVIAGGVFVTLNPEEVISNPLVDIICRGEGEEALVELCEKMSKGDDYSNIKNLWVKKSGTIVKNSMRPLVDVNNLPYIDYDVWGRKRLSRPMFGKIYTMIHVEIDRGCPYDCTYCAAPQLRETLKEENCGVYYRRKSADKVIGEMKYLLEKYSPDYIDFDAESFLVRSVEELRDFGQKYKKEIGLPFWCQTRPETITDEKMKILKDMGCDNMNFGIEHGNDQFRAKILHRYGSNKQMIDGLKLVEKYQIPYTVNNIIGFPDETRELVFDTIEVNHQLNPRTINCYIFAPYKGTPLYDYCIEKGYFTKDDKVHQLMDGGKLKMSSIAYEELQGLQRTFVLYARFPKSEWPEIQKAEKFDDEGNKVFEKYRKIYQEKYFS